MRPLSLKPAEILGANKPHGTRIRYMGGCKCLLCRSANSRYSTNRAALKSRGLDNGLIPSDRAREHLLLLSEKGVGRRTVSTITGIPQSSLALIKNGDKKQIRRNTERRILFTTPEHIKGSSLINAASTWRMINYLLKEGFSKKLLAQRLGYRNPALQINKRRIFVKTSVKIKFFYDRMMVCNE